MTAPAVSLWSGQTVHVRYQPFERRFAYNIVLIDVDIDRLEEASKASAFFKVDRPGLFAFYRRDHGARKDEPLRPWAEAAFAEAGVSLGGGAIRLVTFPRHLFYKFAPLSLWYGYGPDGALRGVLYEVNNTFGETHTYAASVTAPRAQHDADKAFHVSPFFDVTGRYRFTLRAPEKTLDVVVESVLDGARLHMANIKARRAEATSGKLLRLAFERPFSTLGVTAAIHWQALWLWRRGAKYRSKPVPPAAPVTTAHAANTNPPHPERDAA